MWPPKRWEIESGHIRISSWVQGERSSLHTSADSDNHEADEEQEEQKATRKAQARGRKKPAKAKTTRGRAKKVSLPFALKDLTKQK
jgi:hypothetical protein